jgi:hypothetical protein
MPNKTRKPAKPAKPSKAVQRVRLTEQATPTKKGKPDRPAPRTFVLFGADEFAKPRAAKFAADGKELLVKALNLRLVEVTTPDMAAIAAKLPTGRLHATGGGLVPHIKDSLYLELVAENLVDLPSTPRPDPTARDVPGSWDEIAPQGTWSSPKRVKNAAGGKQRSLNETGILSPFATSTTPTAPPLCGIALPSR